MRAVGPPWVKPEELAPIDSDPGNVLGNVLAGPPYFMDGLWPVGHPERAREEARLAEQRGAERTRLEREALGCADTYAPGPPYGTYGLRVPASCVLSYLRRRAACSETPRTVSTPCAYQPRACCVVPWYRVEHPLQVYSETYRVPVLLTLTLTLTLSLALTRSTARRTAFPCC